MKPFILRITVSLSLGCLALSAWAADPLSSWNDTAPKRALIAFVERVTKPGSPDFVPVAERIATFDNDGTLWAEQPVYFQVQFALDRVKALAPQHPEWKDKEPFNHLLAGDMKAFLAGGEKSLLPAMAAAHTGMTTEEFERIVKDWFATAKHPKTGRPYNEMVYQPMLELLAYLRANSFKTFIVSGGGVEFMRVFAEKTYGIPPEQIIGSSGKLKFEMRDGKPVLMKLPEVQFVDDKEGKAIGIQTFLGRRPIAAFGNSDGDLQMLQWTTAGSGARFGLIVHHTDADREWAYDRTSHIGRLDKAWDEANAKGWTVVSMKDDWRTIFPAAQPPQPTGTPTAKSERGKSQAEPESGSNPLGDEEWRLTELNGEPIQRAEGMPPLALKFDAEKKAVSGSTGVNRFMGSYELDAGKLNFGPLATTRRAGSPQLMKQETAFLDALKSASSWKRTGDRLELLSGGKVIAVFVRPTP